MTDPLYRQHILDHARHPRNHGVLADATHRGREANASCGDVCEIAFNDRIMLFDGHGCALSTASASLLCESYEGTLIAPTDEEFLKLLGVEVTSGRLDCALLPLRALRKAL